MEYAKSAGFSHAELTNYVPALRAFARRFYKSEYDIDDLVQDTLTKALANASRFEEGTRLRSWLFTIMRNLFCTRYSMARREQVGIADDAASSLSTQPTQEWLVRGKELEAAITALPDPSGDALRMIFIEGITYEVAAHRSHCPIETVKSRVNRARASLMKTLDHSPNI
ncbi:sigma-70 family RNA polymerase sigma factor [Neorhizobium sp. LMR1-1-1.1]